MRAKNQAKVTKPIYKTTPAGMNGGKTPTNGKLRQMNEKAGRRILFSFLEKEIQFLPISAKNNYICIRINTTFADSIWIISQ
jgi:hypothetical protein